MPVHKAFEQPRTSFSNKLPPHLFNTARPGRLCCHRHCATPNLLGLCEDYTLYNPSLHLASHVLFHLILHYGGGGGGGAGWSASAMQGSLYQSSWTFVPFSLPRRRVADVRKFRGIQGVVSRDWELIRVVHLLTFNVLSNLTLHYLGVFQIESLWVEFREGTNWQRSLEFSTPEFSSI